MKHTHSISPWLVVLGLVLVGLLFVAAFGPTAQAQSTPGPLTPPFRFVEQQQPHAPSIDFVPPGSTFLLTETFGATFAPTTTLAGNTPDWRVYVDPADTAGYYWGRVADTAPVTFTNSAWPAVEPIAGGTVLMPGVDAYPPGQDTWLIYGPIDVSSFTYVYLHFEAWRDIAAGDLLSWGFSTNGQTFYGNQQNGVSSEWVTNTLSMPLDWMIHRSQYLYLGFRFKSDSSPPAGLGAFIRNVQLTAEPTKYVYLSLMLNNYPPTPTPSPTPTPTSTPDPAVVKYTFNTNDSTNLNAWGGARSRTTTGYGGPCIYSQFQRPNHGNPVGSFALNNSCKYVAAYASSNVHLPTNFELVVEVSPWRLYGNEYFGVIFDASDNTFSEGQPTASVAGSYYRLSLATNVGNNLVTAILLEKCINGSCSPLRPSSYPGQALQPPGIVLGQSAYWDEIRIVRIGNNIKVYVNGYLQMNLNDGTFVGPRKFGVHVYPLAGNDAAYPPTGGQMEIDFDNIRVYSR